MRKISTYLTVLYCLPLLIYGCSDNCDPPTDCTPYEETIATKDTEISTLNQQLDSKDQEVWTLHTQISNLEQENTTLENEVSNLEQKKSSLETEVSKQQNSPKTYTVVKAIINVPAGSYNRSMFIVTSDMRNVRLKGYFRETNSSGFYTYVFDSLNFQNWSAGVNSKAIYATEMIVVGQIDIPITYSGTYYIVFSNLHSWFTSKNIDASIELQYET